MGATTTTRMAMSNSSSTIRSLLSVSDLSALVVEEILADARDISGLAAGGRNGTVQSNFSIALVFLEPSLRTRLGFAEAARRLGCHSHDVDALRYRAEMSAPESLLDTLEVVGSMVDAIVVRTGGPLLDCVRGLRGGCPVINAGDGEGNHPSQALIDLYAVRKSFGPTTPLSIGICGDLTMRSARSFFEILAHQKTRRIVAIAPIERVSREGLPDCVELRSAELDCSDLDVLYMAGLPPGHGASRLESDRRDRFALTKRSLERLPDHAIVLSPMPVIDEIAPEARSDGRIKIIEQARDGVAVRMAILRKVLEP